MTGWIFRRLLGATYLLAFWSLARQVIGLIGAHGILPAQLYMEAVRGFATAQHLGIDRFRLFPTLCWISTSDAFLTALCAAGVILSVFLLVGIAPLVVTPLLWLAYLSLSVAAQDFLSYQWDALLLEAGFLSIFIAPAHWLDRLRDAEETPRIGRWLMLWLLVRLMFGSGAMKLASGDLTWRNLTALSYHYETQPIPTPVAWFAHQLPGWFHTGSTAAVLAVELGAPLLVIIPRGPRRLRLVAFALLVGLQAMIALTGNYAFFNLLSVALCVFLLDDRIWSSTLSRMSSRTLGRMWSRTLVLLDDRRSKDLRHSRDLRHMILIAVAVVTFPATLVAFNGAIGMRLPGSQLAEPLARIVAPLRIANTYGLFSVMTTMRPEIIIEGSDDEVEWKEYEFTYKPGDLNRRPPWVAPHQPRLDWQMWFAALGDYETDIWFRRFCNRLLDASPEVLALMGHDPFNGRQPRTVRAVMYQYRFTLSGVEAPALSEVEGWWARERLGELLTVSR